MKRLTGLLCLTTLFISKDVLALSPQHGFGTPLACPISCAAAGNDSAQWTHIHSLEDLEDCDQTVIFDTHIYTPLNGEEEHLVIRACTAEGGQSHSHFDAPTSGCPEDASIHEVQAALKFSWKNDAKAIDSDNFKTVIRQLQQVVSGSDNCVSTTLFARYGDTVAGLFAGTEVQKASVSDLLERVALYASSSDFAEHGQFVSQICGVDDGDPTPASQGFGLAVSENGDLNMVQRAMQAWDVATCVELPEKQIKQEQVKLRLISATAVASIDSESIKSDFNNGKNKGWLASMKNIAMENIGLVDNIKSLDEKDESGPLDSEDRDSGICRYVEVAHGDNCRTLAKKKCHVSEEHFYHVNHVKGGGNSKFCKNLMPRQHVCCTKGHLPVFHPVPRPDGSCFPHTVQSNDLCYKLANKYHVTEKKIEEFNKHTWGWTGCRHLMEGQKICLSKGKPPMPNPIPGARCGPQKHSTQPPKGNQTLADLNPCPLNACCDIWGQCGTTAEFCTRTPAKTGAPGTARPGTNG